MSRYLLDTNVLVYVHDDRDRGKQDRASNLVKRLTMQNAASISVQSLTELAAVLLRKFEPPMPPAHLYEQLDRLTSSLSVLPVTAAVVLEAVRGVDAHSMSFFDAQIWAVARLHQVPVVLSEDFSNDVVLEGVRFRNPFTSDFDVEGL